MKKKKWLVAGTGCLVAGFLLSFENCANTGSSGTAAQNAQSSGGSTSSSSSSGSSSGSSSTGTGTSSQPVFSALSLATLLGQLFEIASTSFSGANSGSTGCTSFGACSGSGPSSEQMTVNCSATGSGSGTAVTGTIPITFSGSGCAVAALSANTITATSNLQITGTGESLSLTSANATNYQGTTVGGGEQIKFNLLSLGGSVGISGLQLVGTNAGGNVNLTVSTATPINLSLSLSSLAIVLNGGEFDVSDNVNKYTASLVAKSVAFGTSCQCPTSGSVSGSISGAITGTVGVQFTSTCGAFQVTFAGTTTPVTVSGCSSTE